MPATAKREFATTPPSRKPAESGRASAVSSPHFLGLDGVPAETIAALLDRADELLPITKGAAPPLETLKGETVGNVFFENSTRTRCSFTFAGWKLGAQVLDISAPISSVQKGETLLDTCRNLKALGCTIFVIRTHQAGGPHAVSRDLGAPVINAGDGRHEHPTQGLLDMMTIRQRLGRISGLHVAIVGDIAGSRVSRSATFGLTTLGARVTFVGPPRLAPRALESLSEHVRVERDFDRVIPEVDAIMMLRVQFERDSGKAIASIEEYKARYQLNMDRVSKMRERAIILHPGPINRGLEITSDAADHAERSAIMDQVTNGVAVRMAVLEQTKERRDEETKK